MKKEKPVKDEKFEDDPQVKYPFAFYFLAHLFFPSQVLMTSAKLQHIGKHL